MQAPKRLTIDNVTKEIIVMYEQGLSLRAIGAKLNMSAQAAHLRLKRIGYHLRALGRNPAMTEEQQEEARRMYAENPNFSRIADHFGVSRGSVTRVIKEMNIKRSR